MRNCTCYIGKLIVHPDFQNKGIGKELMNYVETYFNKAKRYELFTGNKSHRNLHFYKRLGYEKFREKIITEDLALVYMEKLSKSVCP